MDTPGDPFSGKLRAVNSNPHAPGANLAPPLVATGPATLNEESEGTPVPEPRGAAPVREVGGREGLEPTRYGDWEMRGRCIDF
jgi:hypothetical protein